MSNESTARTFAGSVDDARLQMTLEYLYTRLAEVERERDEARAQVERMRPVVEAAAAWRAQGTLAAVDALFAAVDTYRAGTDATPARGGRP